MIFGNAKVCYLSKKITRLGNTKVRFKRQYSQGLEKLKYVIKGNISKMWKYQSTLKIAIFTRFGNTEVCYQMQYL